MLRRSADAPIYVYEHPDTDAERNKVTRGVVLSHMRRIVSAQLQFPGLIPDPIAPPLPVSTSTRRVASIARSFRIYQYSIPARTRPAFTHFDFPCLEEFSCSFGSLAPFNRILGPSLRRLELCQCIPVPSVDYLLDLLSRLTQLEELVLKNAFRSYTLPADNAIATTTYQGPVSLPHLCVLKIVDDSHASVAALGRLIYPPFASVSLQLLHIDEDTSYQQVAEVFRDQFGSANRIQCVIPSQPQSVTIHRHSTTDLELRFWRDRLPVHELRGKRETGESACISFCCPSTNGDLIAALLALAPLSNVKAALLMEPVVTGSLSWDSILLSLSSVEELGLEYETFHNGVANMSWAVSSGDSAMSAMLPNVRNVHVWERRHLHSALPPAALHPFSTLQHAEQMLATRNQSMSGLERGITIERHALDFHEDDGKVCLCEDLVFLDMHPEALRHTHLTQSSPEDGDRGSARLKTWFASRASRIRRSLRRSRQ
ncbi:uncharacterized protein PHACADRAFT_246185 [Phanerochaete carnosa HHB-10118-sp]|uniref:F-box domain-containing protein n=1 Tax=Phanerochaete carnosa (strain HHB-10118-sp) TaxID=650164 RepID=K5W8T8_PHACS|nr:uncharacterized protein PHACADRAFT_246185 [Phanerochaete carnosa HHB-10118-sp]EKM60323.1 hypothetical protein PHACADRAFT_246185 [Phanerochaete carnosa HHB-10118-sp]